MAQTSSKSPAAGGDSTLNAALEVQEYLKNRLTVKNAASPSSDQTIPIIDISSSFSGSLADKQAVASQIHTACTETGFFYITGHGIPADVCTRTLKLAERFFHELTQEQKNAIHMKNSKHFRGYEPAEFTQVNSIEATETKEAFNWGYESGLDPSGGDGKYVDIDGSSGEGNNLWPKEEDLPGFYAGVAEYYGRVSVLIRIISYPSSLTTTLSDSV
jgi:isopenicillin N synthase-like dioxygenase